MSKDEIKAKLDELGINYDGRASEETLKSLLPEDVVVQDSDDLNDQETKEQEETEQNSDQETKDLTSVFKKAVKQEEPKVEKKDNPIEELKKRDYGTLTRGQRLMLRQESEEYNSVDGGVKVTLNDRLPTEKRIIQLADNSFASMLKEKEYSLSDSDYELLKDNQVRVKTEETKNKCCGQARYESVDLLVKVDA